MMCIKCDHDVADCICDDRAERLKSVLRCTLSISVTTTASAFNATLIPPSAARRPGRNENHLEIHFGGY